MKRQVEALIPKALEVVAKEFEKELQNEGIPNVYNGYIAAFGASIIQSGLRPTIAIYENKNASSEGERYRITKMIAQILGLEQDLLDYVVHTNERKAKEQIKAAAIALKLALRTFKIDKGKKDG